MQANFKTNQEVSQCGIKVVQYTKQILQNKKKITYTIRQHTDNILDIHGITQITINNTHFHYKDFFFLIF